MSIGAHSLEASPNPLGYPMLDPSLGVSKIRVSDACSSFLRDSCGFPFILKSNLWLFLDHVGRG